MSTSPRASRLAAAALALVLCAACSGEKVVAEPFDAFDWQFTDAEGDTLANTLALPQRALDVVGLTGTVNAASVVVELTFSTPVLPWSAQATGSVDGFVDFDLDENSESGVPGAASEFGGSAPLGAEYYLSLRDIQAGSSVSLVRVSDYTFRPVPATWRGNVLRVTIPRVLLLNDDGALRISAVVGHPQDPATDFAPSTGFYTVSR